MAEFTLKIEPEKLAEAIFPMMFGGGSVGIRGVAEIPKAFDQLEDLKQHGSFKIEWQQYFEIRDGMQQPVPGKGTYRVQMGWDSDDPPAEESLILELAVSRLRQRLQDMK